MKQIAVVILNWNGAALLERFLPTVIKNSGEIAHIYVADNGSTDSSKELLNTKFPQVSIIEMPFNKGFAGGYNLALKDLNEPLFCLLNSDVAPSENWLNPIITAFKSDPQLAIAQPKILDELKKTHFEYAGAAGGYLDALGYPFCRGRIFQDIEEDLGQYNDSIEVFWATGACMFIRNEVFNRLNGFDESYFAHQEEIDLCWRAKNLGYKVMYLGNSTVYHLGGSTLSNMNPKKTFLNFRNSLFSILKNMPLHRIRHSEQGLSNRCKCKWPLNNSPVIIFFDISKKVKILPKVIHFEFIRRTFSENVVQTNLFFIFSQNNVFTLFFHGMEK